MTAGALQHKYDPEKAHEYYEQYRKFNRQKGRKKGQTPDPQHKQPGSKNSSKNTSGKKNPKKPSTSEATKRAQARVGRLKAKTAKLEGALTKAEEALVKKRASEAKTKRQNSDGKTTAKEKQSEKKYRDKNKAKIKAKDKSAAKKSSGGSSSRSSSSSSSSNSLENMSSSDLMVRISKIKGLLQDARAQLSAAQKNLGSLAHSDILASELKSGGFVLHSTISRKESVKMTADFGGYATRNQVQCSDGRTILPDAFKDNDGTMVPLVWQHGHNDVDNVLGHCKLENREDGVYAHAYFNDTVKGQNAKKMVQHGDLKFLSIFANQLVEKAVGGLKHVAKGNIREVSLVLAGANPGAFIDNVNLVHSDGGFDIDVSEAVISYVGDGFDLELAHAAPAATVTDEAKSTSDSGDDKSLQDVLDTLNEEQTMAVEYLLSQALTVESDVKHSDTDENSVTTSEDEDEEGSDEEASADSESQDAGTDTDTDEGSEESNSDTDTDKDSEGSDAENEAGDDVQHDNINSQEDNSMSHNVFDQAKKTMTATATPHEQTKLAHADVTGIMQDVVSNKGSLKRALQDYALAHGIENIEYLFPDAKTLDNTPNFISRRMEWVDTVLNAVRKTPFSRIKTIHADITADEARAKGYIKGNMKNEEFFTLIKRETTPQTVYKKQKLDRDDVLDITDLDVVAFMKAEMKIMLDEEIASAILIGDGRSNADEEKVREDKIRPIASDSELYVTTATIPLNADGRPDAEAIVDSVIENRRYYKGTGTPTFFTSEDVIGAFLTVKDGFGRRIYSDLNAIATVLRVSSVVSVEVFSRVPDVLGIMVNLTDYSIGTDRGGEATMFDDFDLDYNKLRYLLETRLCGALTLPKSAIVFRSTANTSTSVTAVAPTFDGTTVTVPTVDGVTYMNADTNDTLTTGSPVTLAAGETLNVLAVPASGKYFANNANDEWSFTNTAQA